MYDSQIHCSRLDQQTQQQQHTRQYSKHKAHVLHGTSFLAPPFYLVYLLLNRFSIRFAFPYRFLLVTDDVAYWFFSLSFTIYRVLIGWHRGCILFRAGLPFSLSSPFFKILNQVRISQPMFTCFSSYLHSTSTWFAQFHLCSTSIFCYLPLNRFRISLECFDWSSPFLVGFTGDYHICVCFTELFV